MTIGKTRTRPMTEQNTLSTIIIKFSKTMYITILAIRRITPVTAKSFDGIYTESFVPKIISLTGVFTAFMIAEMENSTCISITSTITGQTVKILTPSWTSIPSTGGGVIPRAENFLIGRNSNVPNTPPQSP